MPSVAASPLSPILTVSAVSAERVVVPGRVAVTVTVVSSAASPALSGLSARVMAPEGAASSSVIVMVSPVTVRPDEVPASRMSSPWPRTMPRAMSLTATEYELLRLLTPNAGRVSTYESLIRQLWNGPDSGDSDRVRAFVKQLRGKLGDDPARPAWMLNERGIGYRVPRPEE